MLPSVLLTTNITFTPTVITKNQYNRESVTPDTLNAFTVKGYITKVSASPVLIGKEMKSYTHLLYINYLNLTQDYIVTVGTEQYEITEIMDTIGNHHTEIGLTILRDI